jgi:hypothetical protein
MRPSHCVLRIVLGVGAWASVIIFLDSRQNDHIWLYYKEDEGHCPRKESHSTSETFFLIGELYDTFENT